MSGGLVCAAGVPLAIDGSAVRRSVAIPAGARWGRWGALIDAPDHHGMNRTVIGTARGCNRLRLAVSARVEVACVYRPIVEHDMVTGAVDVVPYDHLSRRQRRWIG